ncbi:C40 family peptidase [Cellulophaga sp. E16_2]|uniref:C40 family peptidase n=1 Tax=Cellulophaga sp. E16_2 TaxID=2789297 RepID=UPI001A90CC9F|nr:C40 family peptidase [Cellulophaga sp. E16_2]MBO0590666.1 C40 family peptidase [Cellulophaga sp. E16_2]
MNRKFIYLFLIVMATSCGTKKRTISTNNKERKISIEANKSSTKPSVAKNLPNVYTEKPKNNTIAESVISSALEFSGTRYKYGGTTKKGMDCSGLLYVAFGNQDISIPRTSYIIAEEGKDIRIKDVDKGDLLFFKTSKRSKKINHVGLVVSVDNDGIKFIHATTSRGVIVSSLKEGYWNYAFVKATRIL